MITPEILYQAAQIEPASLGEDIINPEDDESTQRTNAIAWIGTNVLPGADAEVSVPFLKVTGYDNVKDFVNGAFPKVAQDVRNGWISKGEALYDAAVKSYGRSEINKCINSMSETYDRDSDQDRIQGNQRLEKLLEWSTVLLQTQGQGSGESDLSLLRSTNGHITVRWA